MTVTEVEIVQATHDDVHDLSDVLSVAFFCSPDVVWAMPDEDTRAGVLPRFAAALLHHAIDIGVVDTTTTRKAAALWWAHDALDPGTYARLVEATCGPYAGTVLNLAAFLAEWTPQQPHHYLAYLGVLPSRQNTGIGSGLLRHRHTFLDRDATPAYLLATTPRSRDLYRRHGYQLRGREPLRPDGGPPLWPMWRPLAEPPKGTTHHGNSTDNACHGLRPGTRRPYPRSHRG